MPGLLELDRFSEADIERWSKLSKDLDELSNILYSGVEPQRLRYHSALLKALQSVPTKPMDFSGWVRQVPWRYTNDPLSAAGSLKNYGGRFNIGADVDNSIHARWPALYIASNQETAYRERFGLSKDEACDGLTSDELVLTTDSSYTLVRLDGHLELVFDLGQAGALDSICAVLRKMTLPAEARKLSKRLKLRTRSVRMISSPSHLLAETLVTNWRSLPVQFGVPSVSQVLASLIIDAGYEGIRYPSTKGDGECVAVFPHRLAGDSSFVSTADPAPESVRYSRLDLTTADELCGWDMLPRQLRPA